MSDVLFKPLRRETLAAALAKWKPSSSGRASSSSSSSNIAARVEQCFRRRSNSSPSQLKPPPPVDLPPSEGDPSGTVNLHRTAGDCSLGWTLG
ncbi:uncharacterized protein ACA1_186080 [Acanthamoeba castellanii str. Neff]|uniref:Uncharacterized protein n=1 Tax=Acanthamoeba castellanii (strain ATCC 30010 / Neff) TaxID=1257118 RepID=L8H544_ACACF|nr:uncharacterized protein ACA1_186080 [Acanthamoeba castellanii str. Neff]ELR20362.1 hypothetical protein ACA1_186080 [Acanthamoeba castellanii str. Neff]